MSANSQIAMELGVPGFWQPCRTLALREVVGFLRQRSRVIGAMGMPLVFWLLAGSMFGAMAGTDGSANQRAYLNYSYPGAIGAIVMFTAVFASISIIDDRREGFMQGVLVSPAPRSAIVGGKILGATILAVGQGLVFLLLAPWAGFPLSVMGIVATFLAMVLMALGVTGLGFWIAWQMETTQGFHAVMNLVLMPLLLLSGAFAPPATSWTWVKWVTALNPISYGMGLVRAALSIGQDVPVSGLAIDDWRVALAVTAAFAAVMFGLSIRAASTQRGQALA